MDYKNLYDVVIIGAGCAGLSAAIYSARAKFKTLVIEKEDFGGQITITDEVVNYPGIRKTSGKKLTETMRIQALDFGAKFLKANCLSVDFEGDIKTIDTDKGEIKALSIILATGASPRKIGFKGEQEFAGRGVAYCATCDGEFFKDLPVFVVGGGYAAAEEAMFLTKFAKSVTIMMIEDDFICAKSIADKVKSNEKIEVLYHTKVNEVGGDDDGLKYLVCEDLKTNKLTKYVMDKDETFGIFVFAGYVPANELAKDKITLNEQGYIVTDVNKKTNIDGVYAAGDVTEKRLRQIVTAVSDGAICATILEHELTEKHERLGIPSLFEENEKIEDVVDDNVDNVSENDEDLDDKFINDEIRNQLKAIFGKFVNKIIINTYLDNSDYSKELEVFMTEVSTISENVKVKFIKDSEKAPYLEFFDENENSLDFRFYGIPSGHEFNSFVFALHTYGVGLELPEDIKEVSDKIQEKIKIDIVVSLSCTICPDLVMNASKLKFSNNNIELNVIDMRIFDEYREKYNIKSVPCMIINEKDTYFGKKSIEEIVSYILK